MKGVGLWESRLRDFHMSTPRPISVLILRWRAPPQEPRRTLCRRPIRQPWADVVIVECEVGAQPGAGLGHRPVVLQVDLLVLHRTARAAREDVVERPAAAGHADLHPRRPQQAREGIAGERRTLVGIENLRPPGRQGAFERVSAELTVQSDRQLPSPGP